MAGGGGVAAAGLAGAGYVGYVWPSTGAATKPPASHRKPGAVSDVEHFRTAPGIRPPRLRVTRVRDTWHPRKVPGYLVLAPKDYQTEHPGQPGAMIADWNGNTVWFLPRPGEDKVPMDCRVQTYRGKPVITWWQGTVIAGHGEGEGVIYDQSYQQVATVKAGNGVQADLHEFMITEDETALVTAYRHRPCDLRAVGGPKDGWALSGVVQEIDISTGDVLFEWDSLDDVDIGETHQALEKSGGKDAPFDYFHINSIEKTPDGDLLVSARNTWALYRVSRKTGTVDWRLGGKRSDFHMPAEARFHWQHDARMHGHNRITLFDNGSSPPKEKQSRGMVLAVDHKKRRVTLHRQIRHPAGLLADNQGSMQLLDDGKAFVCWGCEPYVSLFDKHGKLLRDFRLPAGVQTYRAFTADWQAEPSGDPAILVGDNEARGSTVRASWNGATEVHRWRVLAGEDEGSLKPVATVRRHGFETAIAVASDGPCFVVVALDADGKELGRSTLVTRTS